MIYVTKHAIEQYQRRVACIDSKTAEQRLIKIVKNGSIVFARPNAKRQENGEWDKIYSYRGIEVLAVEKRDGSKVVITCHGDPLLQKWHKQQKNRIRQVSAKIL